MVQGRVEWPQPECECVYTERLLPLFSPFLRGKHGVGRIDIVENRFIGMKSRGEGGFCRIEEPISDM